MKTLIGINGVAGRMGVRILACAVRDPEITIATTVENAHHEAIGHDAGTLIHHAPLGIAIESEVRPKTRMHVMIDFSQPEGTMAALGFCRDRGIPILIGTTGHSPEQRREIQAAAHETAVLHAPNTSLTVAVLGVLVRMAGELLREKGFDVEIVERHHRTRKGTPSGTAQHLSHIIENAMGRSEHERVIHPLRVGDSVGEHTVVFGTEGELLELTQRATSRDCYAYGALKAAKALVGRPAGRYLMADVLGL